MIHWEYVSMMLEGAGSQGYNSAELLRAAGLQQHPEGQSLAIADYVHLMRVVTTAMDDEMMGLLQHRQKIGVFALLCSHASHAPDLFEAQQRLVEGLSLMDNSLQLSQRRQGAGVLLQIQRRKNMTVRNILAVELVLMLLHSFISWLGAAEIRVQLLKLDYPEPKHSKGYRQWLGTVPVRYNASASSLLYPLATMQRPVQRSEAQAGAWARRTPLDALLPSSVSTGVGLEVVSWLEIQLRQQGALPDMHATARVLGLSTHTLRRRLQAQGADYLQLRSQVRRDQGIRLLNTTEDSIEEIASQLGYSEASAFVRAFRGWTGLTPRHYRLGVATVAPRGGG